MIYYKYTKIVEPGPFGTTKSIVLPEIDGQRVGNELGVLDGETYVSLPNDAVLPEQLSEINCQAVTMTDELKSALKAINPHCKLVDQQIRTKIRERYDAEDEMYFARISIGVVMGVYQFLPGEQEAVLAYGAYVEEVREWARLERAKVGL